MRIRMPLPILVILSFAVPVLATEPVNKSFIGGVAIKGYDPVAYFGEGRPVEGSDDFELEWKGAKWRFSTAKNLELFRGSPETYAPAFGGYCAWAVSQGYTAGIDPKAWKIVDGTLYLNYSLAVQKKWEADIPGNIRKANQNWPGILKK